MKQIVFIKLNQHYVVSLILIMSAFVSASAFGATYTMTPDDDWTVLENAQAGDMVEIAPGTYDFRVHLDNSGDADHPIVIRAQDPENRPVWDLVGDESHLVSDAPGSYTAGDRGRGCWQVGQDGGHYQISGIVFRNCRDGASAGFRAVNSGPVKLTDCLFEYNTNGITGASEDYVVEHCEFRNNGKTFEGGNMTHNVYIYGGRFTMRYCYNHDSHEGQLFHIRAAWSVIEYNWMARPSSYVGDIMSCEYLCDGTDQHMTLLGNLIIQGTPENQSQIVALYKDEDTAVSEMNINLYYNTIIGTPRNPGQTHNLLNLRNDSVDTHAMLANNIIYNVGTVAEVANVDLTNWSVASGRNWVSAGTDVTYLSNSIEGTKTVFKDADNLDFTLTETSEAVGEADPTLSEIPLFEYFLNESTICAYRERQGMDDLGAFEFGTVSAGIDAYGENPMSRPDVDSDDTETDSSDTGSAIDIDTATDTDIVDTVSAADSEATDTETVTDTETTNVDTEADTATGHSTADTEGDSSDTPSTSTKSDENDSDSSNDAGSDGDTGSSDSGCGCHISGAAKRWPLISFVVNMLF